MSAFPSLPLFTDAFIADTGHLSAQETGAYLMLMMVAWRSPDCRLPDADDKLARWARVDRRTWLRIKPIVMEFWTLADGFWTQKRLSKERDVVSKRAEAARENGKHGGRPNSLKNNDAGNPAGSARVSGSKPPNPNPNPNQEEPTVLPETHARGGFPPNAFERFWARYPSKVGKAAAEKSFDRVRKSGKVAFDELMAGLERYIANKPHSREWANPQTWLNQGRWEDAWPPDRPAHQGHPTADGPPRGFHALNSKIRDFRNGQSDRAPEFDLQPAGGAPVVQLRRAYG